MLRKESEKDSERPHYYSQFWLDVAAGRRTIGAPRTNEDADGLDHEVAEPVSASRNTRVGGSTASADYREPLEQPEEEDLFDADEFPEPELEELDIVDEEEAEELTPMAIEDADIPDMNLAPLEAEEEETEEAAEEVADVDEEEEEEEEEDIGWTGGRGRKKPKPSRPTRQPKKPKRETRRGF